MNWFEQLTGITEKSPEQVRDQFDLQGRVLTSQANGQSWYCGQFSAPTLHDLRASLARLQEHSVGKVQPAQMQLREVIADVGHLHADERNAGALFQVASQFNMLEMVAPHVTPEQGIGIYDKDPTQGPVSAIACGAGTIWRNYFMPLSGQTGQTSSKQFDALADLGRELHNRGDLWRMVNGYALASQAGLKQISGLLEQADNHLRDHLAGFIRIGIQSDTQVTLPGCQHRVQQVFCSALPVAYSQHSADEWAAFASLVLEAAYEATLIVATQNLLARQQNKVYLTLLGGGAFANREEWIIQAMKRALLQFYDQALDINIVSYGRSNPAVRQLVNELNERLAKQQHTPVTLSTQPQELQEPATVQNQEADSARLKQVMTVYGTLSDLLEQNNDLLVCPACKQPYPLHSRTTETIKLLDQIRLVSRLDAQQDDDKVSMPLCHECSAKVEKDSPVVEANHSPDLSLGGHQVYRYPLASGSIYWIRL